MCGVGARKKAYNQLIWPMTVQFIVLWLRTQSIRGLLYFRGFAIKHYIKILLKRVINDLHAEAKFSMSGVWDKVPEGRIIVFEDILNLFKTVYDRWKEAPMPKTSSVIHSAVYDNTDL